MLQGWWQACGISGSDVELDSCSAFFAELVEVSFDSRSSHGRFTKFSVFPSPVVFGYGDFNLSEVSGEDNLGEYLVAGKEVVFTLLDLFRGEDLMAPLPTEAQGDRLPESRSGKCPVASLGADMEDRCPWCGFSRRDFPVATRTPGDVRIPAGESL